MAVTSTALHNSHIHHHFINQLTVQHHNTRTAVTFGAPSARYRSLATKRPSPTTRETTIKTRSKSIKNDQSIVFQHKRYKSHQEQSDSYSPQAQAPHTTNKHNKRLLCGASGQAIRVLPLIHCSLQRLPSVNQSYQYSK